MDNDKALKSIKVGGVTLERIAKLEDGLDGRAFRVGNYGQELATREGRLVRNASQVTIETAADVEKLQAILETIRASMATEPARTAGQILRRG